ncbi:MAG: hypothetical protein HY842_09400 [Bacteroidetes bacterium]|nr:hypothetical protein [Bacteroidota bacterium]
MKRLSVALLLCGALTNTTSIFAQSTNSTPSRFTISTGIGVIPTYYKAKDRSGFLPLTFKAGYDISKKFNLSGFVGYSSTTAKPKIFADGLGSYIQNKTTLMGLRCEIRKDFSEKVFAYGGSMIGYSRSKVKEYNLDTHALVQRSPDEPTPINPNAPKGSMVYTAFMGANYQVAKRVGLYGEIGYGISILNFGLTVRI